MAENSGRGLPPSGKTAEAVISTPDDPESDAFLSERIALRQRWELASVLNFLRVFKPLLGSNLQVPAEEIEMGLITPNACLAEIHIGLLQGIPPVSKNMFDGDAWVTAVSKQLATWWPWVAEGENPLEADNREEILKYKELDPTTRLLILKALVEVRTEQDDISRYINDALKNGTPITTFRKERTVRDGDGVVYWYDGDSDVGYRLYREVSTAECKQKLKGKEGSEQPTIDTRWETLATNLEEFRHISDNLLSSGSVAKVAMGKIIEIEIVPVLEQLQKKKETALKRQQRQALLLDSFINSSIIGDGHSRRERKPVKYTFDEYDRNIDEAIQISKISKAVKPVKENDTISNGSESSDKENSVHTSQPDDDKDQASDEEDDDTDDDYDEKGDDSSAAAAAADESEESGESEKEEVPLGRTRSRAVLNQKTVAATGLRRSTRTAGLANTTSGNGGKDKGHGGMKKRLRQRPTRNTGYSVIVSSDSGDEIDKPREIISGSEKDSSSSAADSNETDDIHEQKDSSSDESQDSDEQKDSSSSSSADEMQDSDSEDGDGDGDGDGDNK